MELHDAIRSGTSHGVMDAQALAIVLLDPDGTYTEGDNYRTIGKKRRAAAARLADAPAVWKREARDVLAAILLDATAHRDGYEALHQFLHALLSEANALEQTRAHQGLTFIITGPTRAGTSVSILDSEDVDTARSSSASLSIENPPEYPRSTDSAAVIDTICEQALRRARPGSADEPDAASGFIARSLRAHLESPAFARRSAQREIEHALYGTLLA